MKHNLPTFSRASTSLREAVREYLPSEVHHDVRRATRNVQDRLDRHVLGGHVERHEQENGRSSCGTATRCSNRSHHAGRGQLPKRLTAKFSGQKVNTCEKIYLEPNALSRNGWSQNGDG